MEALPAFRDRSSQIVWASGGAQKFRPKQLDGDCSDDVITIEDLVFVAVLRFAIGLSLLLLAIIANTVSISNDSKQQQ